MLARPKPLNPPCFLQVREVERGIEGGEKASWATFDQQAFVRKCQLYVE